jgi:hypothetical protein
MEMDSQCDTCHRSSGIPGALLENFIPSNSCSTPNIHNDYFGSGEDDQQPGSIPGDTITSSNPWKKAPHNVNDIKFIIRKLLRHEWHTVWFQNGSFVPRWIEFVHNRKSFTAANIAPVWLFITVCIRRTDCWWNLVLNVRYHCGG